jgi:hypothetical protein
MANWALANGRTQLWIRFGIVAAFFTGIVVGIVVDIVVDNILSDIVTFSVDIVRKCGITGMVVTLGFTFSQCDQCEDRAAERIDEKQSE